MKFLRRCFVVLIFGLLFVYFVGAIVAIYLAVADTPKPPDVRFLASDAHFMIAGQSLTIPVVALRRPGHVFDLGRKQSTGFREQIQEASDPANPKPVQTINLSIRRYQRISEQSGSPDICPLLTRRWSEAVCRGKQTGLLSRLPSSFDLLDRNSPRLLNNYIAAGGERIYDRIKDAVGLGMIGVGCARTSCTAVVEASPGLLAVWFVWSDDRTGATAQQMADSQGPAIVQFVRRAIGPVEDLTLLDAQ
jgi:hypothetical protein